MIKLNVMVIFMLTFISACAVTTPQTDNAQVSQTITDAELKLNQRIENKECDGSFQCKILPIGQQPCGEPSRYVVYSTKHTATEQAERMAAEITEFEKIYNQQSPALAGCQSISIPQALCLNNTCQEYKLNTQ